MILQDMFLGICYVPGRRIQGPAKRSLLKGLPRFAAAGLGWSNLEPGLE